MRAVPWRTFRWRHGQEHYSGTYWSWVMLPCSCCSRRATCCRTSGLLYDSIAGLIVINVAFQAGFCVFVLSNFMRTIPGEMYEAAQVDGASMWPRYWRLTLPLCRPALAALPPCSPLDIQRLLLGDHPHGDRQQTPDHLGPR